MPGISLREALLRRSATENSPHQRAAVAFCDLIAHLICGQTNYDEANVFHLVGIHLVGIHLVGTLMISSAVALRCPRVLEMFIACSGDNVFC